MRLHGRNLNVSALWQGIKRIAQKIEKELAELLVVGLNGQRLVSQFATDLHLLLIGAGTNQFQGLPERSTHVLRPFLQCRRPGKIEKGLDRTLQTRRLRFQHGQIAIR